MTESTSVATTFVVIPEEVHKTIASWAESAYPHEGCGLLFGEFSKEAKLVRKFVPLENKLLKRSFLDVEGGNAAEAESIRLSTLPPERRNKPEIGFAFDPSEFNRETLKAEKEGMDMVGVLHTHPDHPPRPSQIDASQPFLAQWSNVIVAVENGKMREMKSWFREEDNLPFEEEEIRIKI